MGTGKVNIVGALAKLKFPVTFKSAQKNKKKLRKSGNLYAIGFWQNQFWFLV